MIKSFAVLRALNIHWQGETDPIHAQMNKIEWACTNHFISGVIGSRKVAINLDTNEMSFIEDDQIATFDYTQRAFIGWINKVTK